MITIVDVGLGNVASVQNMLARIGAPVRIAAVPDHDSLSGPIVLPGVGAFDTGIARLRDAGWFDELGALPSSHPVLGICLGMQILGQGSAEGSLDGLGRIPVNFKRFPSQGLPVPHMGWNHLADVRDDALLEGLPKRSRFYFTHSYYGYTGDPACVVASADYGIRFAAVVKQGGTYGVQFHPEKSHRFGMALLAAWVKQC